MTKSGCIPISDEEKYTSNGSIVSPPTYTVQEIDGKLYNSTLDICWPKRPLSGYHSLAEYKKRKRLIKKKEKEDLENQKNLEKLVQISEEDITQLDFEPYTYVGCKSRSGITKLLKKKTLFYIYHESDEIGDLKTLNLPLKLAYKSSEGKNFFFKINRSTRNYCYIEYGPKMRSEVYSCLEKMVECLRLYGHMDYEKGTFDMFPIADIEKRSIKRR
uniref:IRS-type PTB domain-containing protein n=1 Tax=Strongyloides stercoralis TaxID=6248 RepID=A0A0K0EEF0_STRER